MESRDTFPWFSTCLRAKCPLLLNRCNFSTREESRFEFLDWYVIEWRVLWRARTITRLVNANSLNRDFADSIRDTTFAAWCFNETTRTNDAIRKMLYTRKRWEKVDPRETRSRTLFERDFRHERRFSAKNVKPILRVLFSRADPIPPSLSLRVAEIRFHGSDDGSN